MLLRCPVCDAVRALDASDGDYRKERVFPVVKRHLRGHSLEESKAVIRKHQMADETRRLIVSADEFERLPVDDWCERAAAWLPEGVTPAAGASDGRPEPSAERHGARGEE
ncbi:MAG: hypothetical protein A07HR67_02374 [uncultured archaeon A07HR67]|nr:MAG: hypothetical protein A07HR67_02374 [uncultured archaeon A07HR67]